MNAQAFPDGWNEPDVTPEERTASAFLEEAMARHERGDAPLPASAAAAPAKLVRDLSQLRTVAETFRRCARLLDDSRVPITETLMHEPAITAALPDPFPGKFRIEKLLGQGAFGEVWLAEDPNLGCHRALKTIRLSGSAGDCAARLAALRQEARTLARLRHANIVQVHGWEQAGDDHYLVLEYVSGGSLEDRVRKDGPLSWEDAARYVADVGEGLVAVPSAGLVHLDIKPANILWQPDVGEALLTDFGITAKQTDPGRVAGTPPFMSPEAICGQEAKPGMDVYSLSATLFQLVVGGVPFEPASAKDGSVNLGDLLQQIERGLPDPDPRCANLPRPLERLLRKGLAPDPRQRPALAEFVAALRGSLNQLLADSLVQPPPVGTGPGVELRLVVSRRVGPDTYQPVATTHPQPERVQRNMKKVPRPPEQVRLRTGDEVRVEVTSSRTGYVTVFNVGPTGDLNLLFPEETPATGAAPTIEANRPLHVLDVVMEPPAGRERLFAVWSSRPLRLDQLHAVAENGAIPASGQYQATRNMVKFKKVVEGLQAEEGRVIVVEVEHVAEGGH